MKKLPLSTNNGETTDSEDNSNVFEDIDSSCSTPFVSAPSSPGRNGTGGGGGGSFFYSAPASPMHYLLSSSSIITPTSSPPPESSYEDFDFSASWYSTTRPMSSADELFLNGEIRPMKLSAHLQKPQKLAPLIGVEENVSEDDEVVDDNERKIGRGRSEMKLRNRSLRRIRSMSPLRSESTWQENENENDKAEDTVSKEEEKSDDVAAREEDAPPSGSASRSSSVGRNSKRWVSLKDFLYRSKSEGRNNGRHKYFWSSLSFSPIKDKKTPAASENQSALDHHKLKDKQVKERTIQTASEKSNPAEGDNITKKENRRTAARGKRMVLSAHELHYTVNRAQAEEMRKKTSLPYRQGLFGCLGFNSKGYGALNSFARALNSVPSN